MDSAAHFESIMLVALSEPGVRALLVNMDGVTFIDAAGLRALVRARNTALALEKQIFLHPAPPTVERLLRLTGLDHVFSFAPIPSDLQPAAGPLHDR